MLPRGWDSRQLLPDVRGVEFGSEFGFAFELVEHVHKMPNEGGGIWRDVLHRSGFFSVNRMHRLSVESRRQLTGGVCEYCTFAPVVIRPVDP